MKRVSKSIVRASGKHARRTALAFVAALLAALIMALPAWAGVVRSNPTAITINDNAAAAPYPSTINVTGLPNRGIVDINVTLNGLSHPFADALDILLLGPQGQKVMLMSDAGGAAALTNQTLTFDDEPTTTVPDGSFPNFRYSPTNYETPDNMPSPAPAEPYATSLSVFDGTNPNGPWNLFVRDDDGFGDTGRIAGGWSLDISVPSQNNDNFSNAQAINTSTAIISGDNFASGFEAGEPNSTGGGSVWYRWTAPNTGQTNIDTCNTDYDPIMGIFTGSAVNSLTPAPGLGLINNGCPSGFGDKTTFNAQAGTTYNIQIGGWPGGAPQGNFSLNLSGPANTPPAITPLSPLSPTRDRTPLVRATVTDTVGLSASNIRLLLDNKARTFSYDPVSGALSYTSSRLSFGKHVVKIVATDAHTAMTTKSWSFTVKR